VSANGKIGWLPTDQYRDAMPARASVHQFSDAIDAAAFSGGVLARHLLPVAAIVATALTA
jgi:hypothetical protein